MNDIDKIHNLNATDESIDFSSQAGPCRYISGESYELRSAKANKILESIKRGHVGPSRRALNQHTINHLKWKIENGE